MHYPGLMVWVDTMSDHILIVRHGTVVLANTSNTIPFELYYFSVTIHSDTMIDLTSVLGQCDRCFTAK